MKYRREELQLRILALIFIKDHRVPLAPLETILPERVRRVLSSLLLGLLAVEPRREAVVSPVDRNLLSQEHGCAMAVLNHFVDVKDKLNGPCGFVWAIPATRCKGLFEDISHSN